MDSNFNLSFPINRKQFSTSVKAMHYLNYLAGIITQQAVEFGKSNNNKNNKILSYQSNLSRVRMSQIKQQSAIYTSNELNPNHSHLQPLRNISSFNQSSINNAENNKIDNVEQIPNSHFHSKTIDDSLKSSGNHFGNNLNGNRSLKKGFASNNNMDSSKVRYSNKKYNTLKNNDNIKRIQRLYTDANGYQQFHSRLLLPNNSQNSYVQKSLVQSYPQQEAKQSQQYNKQHPPSLSKQELYQQNMKLKSKLNEMKQTLTRQKIQTQIQKKKNKKYTMQLNREFKKELYINNMKGSKMPQENSEEQKIAKLYTNQESDPQNEQIIEKPHQFSEILPKTSYYRIPASLGPPSLEPHSNQYMIAGIKQKYEQLKIQYEKIAKELKVMKATDAVKKLQQVSVYCVTLQQSNCRLAVALDVANKKLYAYENPIGHTLQGKNKDIQIYTQAVILEVSNKLEQLKVKNIKKRQENKKLKQEQKQNQKLIKYLEAMLTSKSTLLYNQQRALKKTSSAIKEIESQLLDQKKSSEILKQSYMTQMEEISEKYDKKIEKEKRLFQQALVQKNSQIKKLQKEIGYLTMIVDNWRGTDDKDKNKQQKQKDEQKSISTAKKRKESTLNGKIDFDKGSDKNSASNSFIKYTERKQLEKQYEQKVNQLASFTNRAHLNSREDQLQRTNTKDKIKLPQRKRKSSGFKNSQNSKKRRKVPVEQIIDLAQFIRYRFIGSKRSIEDIAEILSYEAKQAEDPQEIKWKNQYLTQGELMKILQSEPFLIPAPMSELLSRYVVEDQCVYENGSNDNAFVYTDPINEIQRTIAKSILRAFIQTTSSNFISLKNVSTVFQQCQKQWSAVIEKFGSKINTPLISIASSGFISKERWNQLLTSLSIQVSEYLRQWCIGKMILQSQSLNKLKYRSIVPDYI